MEWTDWDHMPSFKLDLTNMLSFVNIRKEHIDKRLLNYCDPTGSLLGPIAIIPSYIRKISKIADKRNK